jgi:hypothetical protein
MTVSREFATLYNDDEHGRCASKDCCYRTACANHPFGAFVDEPKRFRPRISADIDSKGVIFLACESYTEPT